MFMTRKELIIWGAVGTASNGLDYAIFLVCYQISGSISLSNLISVLGSSAFNFYMHRTLTFRNKSRILPQAIKYSVYQIFVWLLGTILITLLYQVGAPIGAAKLLPLIIIAPINYFSLKFFVYKN
jgi:putative flippase GtrA